MRVLLRSCAGARAAPTSAAPARRPFLTLPPTPTPPPRSKYSSFLRSLSYYNFKRQPRCDADSCEYTHAVLHRDHPDRTAHILRKPNTVSAAAKAARMPQAVRGGAQAQHMHAPQAHGRGEPPHGM